MTHEQAEAEMLQGYRDGRAGEPDPGGNRSFSYRHGWINGNADRNNRGDQWPSLEVAKRKADECIAADTKHYSF